MIKLVCTAVVVLLAAPALSQTVIPQTQEAKLTSLTSGWVLAFGSGIVREDLLSASSQPNVNVPSYGYSIGLTGKRYIGGGRHFFLHPSLNFIDRPHTEVLLATITGPDQVIPDGVVSIISGNYGNEAWRPSVFNDSGREEFFPNMRFLQLALGSGYTLRVGKHSELEASLNLGVSRFLNPYTSYDPYRLSGGLGDVYRFRDETQGTVTKVEPYRNFRLSTFARVGYAHWLSQRIALQINVKYGRDLSQTYINDLRVGPGKYQPRWQTSAATIGIRYAFSRNRGLR